MTISKGEKSPLYFSLHCRAVLRWQTAVLNQLHCRHQYGPHNQHWFNLWKLAAFITMVVMRQEWGRPMGRSMSIYMSWLWLRAAQLTLANKANTKVLRCHHTQCKRLFRAVIVTFSCNDFKLMKTHHVSRSYHLKMWRKSKPRNYIGKFNSFQANERFQGKFHNRP